MRGKGVCRYCVIMDNSIVTMHVVFYVSIPLQIWTFSYQFLQLISLKFWEYFEYSLVIVFFIQNCHEYMKPSPDTSIFQVLKKSAIFTKNH